MIFDRVLFKFIIAGLANTIAGLCVMFVMYNIAGFSYWVSSAANYVVGSILSFYLNKYWTFQVCKWSLYMVISFIATIAISYFLAYKIARTALHFALAEYPPKIRDNAALFTGMCMFTGFNYIGQRFIVFTKK
jgi:putative flippase GtrA